MSKYNKTVKETIATWTIFIAVVGVMFLAIMTAISSSYSDAQQYTEAKLMEYEEYLGE